jgi:hypothetical protein
MRRIMSLLAAGSVFVLLVFDGAAPATAAPPRVP